MTRSQRRIRARKASQLASETRRHAAGIYLAENANAGKRHAARLSSETVDWLSGCVAREANAATLQHHARQRRSDGRLYPDKREANGTPSPASYVTTYGKRQVWTPELDS